MPVILSRENEKRWMDNKLDRDKIKALLNPYDAAQMEAYTVDKSISKLGFNTINPAVLNKKEYKDLPPLIKS